MGTGIIIGMFSLSIVSTVIEKALASGGKVDEAAWVGLITKGIVGVSVLTTMATLIQKMRALG